MKGAYLLFLALPEVLLLVFPAVRFSPEFVLFLPVLFVELAELTLFFEVRLSIIQCSFPYPGRDSARLLDWKPCAAPQL